MKYKYTYSIVLLVITSLVLAWFIPSWVKITSTTSQRYPFVYFSSLAQRFVIKDINSQSTKFYDTTGQEYTQTTYDSILPLLNYRQLMLDNRMPDTILGQAVDARQLRMKTIVWRYMPKKINTPSLDLYLMYESMHGRTSLESPNDVFRLTDRIEFVSKETNTIEVEKSKVFQTKMEDAKFSFPAQHVWGNLSARKPYDEGYFVLDSKSRLFHIKMVNGKPYVRDTNASEHINIKVFNILEVADKSIYGFIVSEEGYIYTLNEQYTVTKFDIPPIDLEQDNVLLMSNIFYWMVNVTTDEKCTYNVLESQTLKQHSEPYVVEGSPDRWDLISSCTFPIYISLNNKYSDYITPQIHINWGIAFLISMVLALVFNFSIGRKRKLLKRIVDFIVITIFGVPGLIASLIIK